MTAGQFKAMLILLSYILLQ